MLKFPNIFKILFIKNSTLSLILNFNDFQTILLQIVHDELEFFVTHTVRWAWRVEIVCYFPYNSST